MRILFRRIIIINLVLLFSSHTLFGQDDFSSFMTEEEVSSLEWSGDGIINTRYNLNYSNLLDSDIDVYPEINMNLDYIGKQSEFHGEIGFSANSPLLREQLIKEAYLQLFLDNFNIEMGFMKLIWGKGDNVFTFDNLNAVDYTDFINKPYIDQKIAETMFKINIPFGMQGLVEAVYTPVFTSDIYPSENEKWNQTAYNLINLAEGSSAFADSQLGLRFTNSIGGFDIGVSYQYTFLRESLIDSDVSELPFNSLDRVHIFGAETAFIVAAFNIWAETAYYMTNDFKGNDPLVHNNILLSLFGISRDIMIHNISLNIQLNNELKFTQDRITDTSDIDYKSDNVYKLHMLTASLKDSFLNERITTELKGTYSFEYNDFIITPELRMNLIEDTWLYMKYSFFYGESDTLFGQFKNNDFFEIKIKYSF